MMWLKSASYESVRMCKVHNTCIHIFVVSFFDISIYPESPKTILGPCFCLKTNEALPSIPLTWHVPDSGTALNGHQEPAKQRAWCLKLAKLRTPM